MALKSNIEEINKNRANELKSDDFMNMLIFLQRYKDRKSHLKEEALLELIGKDSIVFFNMNNKQKKEYSIQKLKQIKKFYQTLYEEDIEPNIFLKTAHEALTISKEECNNIVYDTINYYNELKKSNKIQKIKLNIPISKESLEKYRSKITIDKTRYDRNIEYYTSYNEIISSLHEVIINIYTCRIWKDIPNKYINNIGLNHFDIINNGNNQEYVVNMLASKVKKKSK